MLCKGNIETHMLRSVTGAGGHPVSVEKASQAQFLLLWSRGSLSNSTLQGCIPGLLSCAGQ